MLRTLLLASLAFLPLAAMAQSPSPWGSNSPTYVARGAQLPAVTRIEYAPPNPNTVILPGPSMVISSNPAPAAMMNVVPLSGPSMVISSSPVPAATMNVVPAPGPGMVISSSPAPAAMMNMVPSPGPNMVISSSPLPTGMVTSPGTIISSTPFAGEWTAPGEVFASQVPPGTFVESVPYSTPAGASGLPFAECLTCCQLPKCGWVRYEQLSWTMDGGRLPPLVTTSPSGTSTAQAGVLGKPGTSVLFGGKDYLDEQRNGYRISAGGWLTPDQVLGIEGSYFTLDGDKTRFGADSLRYSILAASPFVNAANGEAQRVLIAYPGVLSGETGITYESKQFTGYDLFARVLLSNQIFGRLDGLVGYRNLQYGESLAIRKRLIPDPNGPVPVVPGSEILCDDYFDTATDFHGFALGLNWEACYCNWFINVRPRVTLGQADQTVNRDGLTVISVPGNEAQIYPGGTYNLQSNLGQQTKKSFMAVPELDLQVGYTFGNCLRVFGGYSCIYIPKVVRAGDQIDNRVNVDLIPPVLPTGGPNFPAATINRSSAIFQGFSVGVELRY